VAPKPKEEEKAVQEQPAAAEPATQSSSEKDDTTFQGPDPTGTVCWWTYNPSDGWCYTPTSSWIYNAQTAVYHNNETGKFCQYDGSTGVTTHGTCEPDETGAIHFVPTPADTAPAPAPAPAPAAAAPAPARPASRGSFSARGGAGYSSSATEAPKRPGSARVVDATAQARSADPSFGRSLDSNQVNRFERPRRQLDAMALLKGGNGAGTTRRAADLY